VALFRRPLNLPIPHTAIIPRNKDRIARGLSEFIQHNFLSAGALVQRIAEFRPAHTLCRWLLQPANVDTVATYASRFLAYALAAIDDARVQRFLQRTVSAGIGKLDLAGAAGQLLDLLTENKRHHALLDAALNGLDDLLAKEDTRGFIAAEVAKSAPLLKKLSDLFSLNLDERAALKIVEISIAKISEVRRDGDHELRRKFERNLMPALGTKPVRELTDADLLAVLRHVGRTRKRAGTAQHLLSATRQIFHWAIIKRQPWRSLLTDGNPADLVEPKQVVPHGYQPVIRERTLCAAEIRQLRDIFEMTSSECEAAGVQGHAALWQVL